MLLARCAELNQSTGSMWIRSTHFSTELRSNLLWEQQNTFHIPSQPSQDPPMVVLTLNFLCWRTIVRAAQTNNS